MKAVDEARTVLANAIDEWQPVAVVGLFSGGNDSTVMVHMLNDLLTHVAHINTGTGIPETTEFVRRVAGGLKAEYIELVTPPEVYETFLFDPAALRVKEPKKPLEPGFPGPSAHTSIYYYLKQMRLRELNRRFVKHPRRERVMWVTGIRATESARRMGRAMSVPVKRDRSVVWVNPILHFDTALMNEYRRLFDPPRNEVADHLHRSGECLCGAYAKPEELEQIAFFYPEVAERIRGLEKRLEDAGVKRCKWGGQDNARVAHQKHQDGMELCSACQ